MKNGLFPVKRIITINTTRRTINTEALFNEKLPVNLVRVMTTVKILGAILIDRVGAVAVPQRIYHKIKHE